MATAEGGGAGPRVEHRDGGEGSTASSLDALDQLLADYNFTCHPEGRIKFKQQVWGASLGLCVAKPWSARPRLRLTVKPDPGDRPDGFFAKTIQKLLLVPGHSQVALFSRKISLRWLRLQAVAGYNWARQKPTLDYRLTTKWGDGPRLKRKERFSMLNDTVGLRCKWNLEFNLPDMQGHIGEDNLGMDPVDVDWGRMDFEISQLDCVLRCPKALWRGGRDDEAAKEAARAKEAGEVQHKWAPKFPWEQWAQAPRPPRR